MLREQINESLKDAMRAKDARRVSTLRMVNAAIKDRDIEARGLGKGPLSDADLLGLFQKMIKQRQESLSLYEKGGRDDLAAQEREEIDIISTYLPQQMPEAETRGVIELVIREVGAASVKDMGRVMAVLKERYTGRMDFGKASATIKSLLG